MRATGHCPYCPKTFENASEGLVKANIANHVRRKHPGKLTKPSKYSLAHGKVNNRGVSSSPLGLDNVLRKDPGDWKDDSAPAPKRPYNRQPKAAKTANFCPNCGCNMQVVGVAMGL